MPRQPKRWHDPLGRPGPSSSRLGGHNVANEPPPDDEVEFVSERPVDRTRKRSASDAGLATEHSRFRNPHRAIDVAINNLNTAIAKASTAITHASNRARNPEGELGEKLLEEAHYQAVFPWAGYRNPLRSTMNSEMHVVNTAIEDASTAITQVANSARNLQGVMGEEEDQFVYLVFETRIPKLSQHTPSSRWDRIILFPEHGKEPALKGCYSNLEAANDHVRLLWESDDAMTMRGGNFIPGQKHCYWVAPSPNVDREGNCVYVERRAIRGRSLRGRHWEKPLDGYDAQTAAMTTRLVERRGVVEE
ncbi:hypothetical protein HYFRA_00004799 [Hymenoscyphus fraxineus]|uniref:Uncharacterized protein n=1 Tax=Hymenoscyphus fraxineus TaxID=746836 RepID=A0A9N9PJX8_9HELO|nr:hypothetical protein HYFRA_00004799 [Hymenoscyphus fraxineus]